MFERDDDGKKVPSTYFHAARTSNRKILPIDIANDSIVDLQLTNRKVDIFTRKNNKPRNERYTVFSPSLPLTTANCCEAVVTEDFLDLFNRRNLSRKYYKSKAYQQFTQLKSKQCKVFHQSLQDVPDCGPEFVKKLAACSRISASEYKIACNKRKIISEFISDVSRDVAVELLDESLFTLADETNKNLNLRNCIGCFRNRGHKYLIFPTGKLMDSLAVREVITCGKEGSEDRGFKMMTLGYVAELRIGAMVKEVSVTEDSMIHVRCDYQYQVFGVNSSNDSIELVQKFVYNFGRYLHSIGTNQSNSREMFVVAADGSVFHFDGSSCDGPGKTFASSTDSSKAAIPWHNCMYGTSRETCLVLNERTLAMYDFRCKEPTLKTYFDIACEYINEETRKLTPVLKWNPMNCHQYFLATDQSILLNDERYLKTPVLQCNHYLKSSPRFLQTLYDEEHDSESMLLCVAAYKSADSVLYKLHCNGLQEVSMGNGPLLNMARPVTVTQPLYQLSQFNDWKTYIPAWEFTLSHVRNRLAQPIIGLSLFPSSGDSNSHRIDVLQQTLCGDLYFQQILSTPHVEEEEEDRMIGSFRRFNSDSTLFTTTLLTRNESDHHVVLADDARMRCREWIDSAIKMPIETTVSTAPEKESELSAIDYRHCLLRSDKIFTKDVQKICQHVRNVSSKTGNQKKSEIDSSVDTALDSLNTNLTTTDTCCSTKKSNGHENDNGDSSGIDTNRTEKPENNKCEAGTDKDNSFNSSRLCFCEECGKKLSGDVLKTRNNAGVLTRSKLNLPPVSLPLKTVNTLDDVERSGKPLNQLLDAQWNEDAYVPLDKFAPNVKFYQYPDFVPSP